MAVLLAIAAPAYAQYRTVENTTLWNKPKGKRKPVARLERGQEVEVLERSGKWVRVRAGKRKGWVRASTITDKSRKRSKKAKASDQASGQTADQAPGEASDQTGEAAGGTIARPKGAGWRGIGSDDAVSENWVAESPETADAAAQAEAAKPRPHRGRVVLAAGYQGIDMNFHAQTVDSVMDYEAAANALMVSAGGAYSLLPKHWPILAEIEASYALSYADSGLHYLNADGAYYEIPFSAHTARAGVNFGYRMADRLHIAASVGYQLEATLFQEVDARALLPRERLHGLTVGGRVRVMPGLKSLAVRLGADYWLLGTRTQTRGLEDGTDTQVDVWAAHAGLDYRLLAHFNILLQYSLQRAATEWNGASSRLMGVDHATRDDVSYMIYVGLGRSL